MSKIYDAFIFFNELDLLELRLNILNKYVDYFVIVEADETFTGITKPLYFAENRERFKKWLPKIKHYVVRNMPIGDKDLIWRFTDYEPLDKTDRQIVLYTLLADNIPHNETQWTREFYQKESINKALLGLNDDDVVFISDVDEIWNPEIRYDFNTDEVLKMNQTVYAYYLNNRSSEPWSGTIMAKYKNVKNASINHLDHSTDSPHKFIENGGWHFTNQGGVNQIRRKLESYGHQEFNTDKIKKRLDKQIANNRDFIGRNFKFLKDESDLPQYILDNRDKYKDWLK